MSEIERSNIRDMNDIANYPDQALSRQMELYREMTGEQRLEGRPRPAHVCLRRRERGGIGRQYSDATDDEVEQHPRRRIELGPPTLSIIR